LTKIGHHVNLLGLNRCAGIRISGDIGVTGNK
jgi:hypothetical protein